MRAVCGGPRGGDRGRGAADSERADEPGGGHLGATTGAGGPSGRALAGAGTGGGVRIDGSGAGIQSDWVVADGYICSFRSEQKRTYLQPRPGGGVTWLWGPAME